MSTRCSAHAVCAAHAHCRGASSAAADFTLACVYIYIYTSVYVHFYIYIYICTQANNSLDSYGDTYYVTGSKEKTSMRYVRCFLSFLTIDL